MKQPVPGTLAVGKIIGPKLASCVGDAIIEAVSQGFGVDARIQLWSSVLPRHKAGGPLDCILINRYILKKVMSHIANAP